MQKNEKGPIEFTPLAIILGVVIGVIMTAANVYLGLYAGMTVSASIPAAVIAMGVFKMLKQKSVHQSNIVQTMASAGESLAAGIIFTLPALVIVGAWTEFKFWPTTLIAIAGGLLGIIFMIPLRRALIVDDKELTYPEGVACAAVLEAGAETSEENDTGNKGFITILKGLLVGGVFKFLIQGLKVFKGEVAKAFVAGNKVWFFGTDASPALMAVGYIVKLEVAVLVFIGGAIGWFIGIPLLGLEANMLSMDPVDAAFTLWSSKIRYLGVGAMLTGGVWSIISVRKGISKGLTEIKNTYRASSHVQVSRVNQDMSLIGMVTILVFSISVMFGLYYMIIGQLGHTVLTTVIMVVASFLFVAVSSYIVGLVGSSNNPVSGMTISALLGTASLFLVLGYTGESAILATLGVAAVVCCAACTAGDCSQDLKTGVLIGATPKYQQYAQIIGVIIPAFVIAPVLTLLHTTEGIGVGLKAPQATLFASITKALFGKGDIPMDIVAMGIVLGIIILIVDGVLKSKKSKFRCHLMPLAVGIYLPVTLAVPMLVGGLIRYFIDKKRNASEKENESTDGGILLSSGIIAGEAVMGIVVSILLVMGIKPAIGGIGHGIQEVMSLVALVLVAFYLWKKSKEKH